jgi:hypothetical protein
MTVAGETWTPVGGTDGFIVRMTPGREVVWALQLGGPGSDAVYSVDTVGKDVVVAGTFTGSVDFGGTTLAASTADGFVARYSPSGKLRWVRRIGAMGTEEAFAVVVTDEAEVVVAGYYEGLGPDLGDGPLRRAQGSDLYVARFTADGDHISSYAFGGPGNELPSALAATPDGGAVLVGTFEGEMSAAGSDLESEGGQDVLVLRLSR